MGIGCDERQPLHFGNRSRFVQSWRIGICRRQGNRSRTTSDRNGDSLNGPIQNPLPFTSPPLPYTYVCKEKEAIEEAIHRR